MKAIVVVQMSEKAESHPPVPSWSGLMAFYRTHPKVLLITVALVTATNLAWVIDHLT